MLGVSSAATVGLHFQENYCGSAAYSGFPVTLTAFGINPSSWENLIPMQTGYSSCDPMAYYTLNEVIDTTTSTNGLNPLPAGSLNVTWSANGANFSGFAGYNNTTIAPAPGYGYDGDPPTPIPTGEWQIYSTFLRDGVNFGVGSSGGDNDASGYLVDITGLKSLFPTNSFVVELMAASDSMQYLTNAFIVDATANVTNSTVAYTNTPFPFRNEGGGPAWYRGHGGGLSTVSGTLNTDHVQIIGNRAAHGVNSSANGYDNASTISGFIVTDKPVVSMSPQPIPSVEPGESVLLSAYAIGVPPLSYQWRLNGAKILNATNLSYAISNVTLASGGNFDLVVTNLYGATTSQVSTVTVDHLVFTSVSSNVVYDSNLANPQHVGLNMGATWEASSSDGTLNRTGVMSFTAANSNGISVVDSPGFDGPVGTVSFWMRSAGTDTSLPGENGTLFCRPNGTSGNDFLISQLDGAPNLYIQGPTGSGNVIESQGGVSDNKWHFVALTFDQSAAGGIALYIDGALDTTNSNGGAWSWDIGQPLEIGYSSDPIFRDYNGLLDDVRYYSAELSSSQIATIYSGANNGPLVNTNALQLQFNFSSAPSGGLDVNWMNSSAVLQSAPTVSGPWTDLPGVKSPYTLVPGATQQYFRYRFVLQALLISNPYLM